MNPTEAIPLLIVVLLLVSIGGADVERMEVTFEGEQDVRAIDDVLVVAGGTSTVPAEATVEGDVYVIGGTVRIDGSVDGDVAILAGTLAVTESGRVSGTVDRYGGDATVAEGADVGTVSTFAETVPAESTERQIGGFALRVLVLAVAGWWFGRRRPALLANVGHSITDHALVSGVVGTLTGITLLVLFVYMAFTIVLLPVSVLGLLGLVLVAGYAQLVFGHLIGTRLPVGRRGLATAVGVAAFLVATELVALVPYLGALVQIGLVAVGTGAVLLTYFGLQRFEPAPIPGGRA